MILHTIMHKYTKDVVTQPIINTEIADHKMHATTVQTQGSYSPCTCVCLLVGEQLTNTWCVHDVWEPVEGGNVLWDMIHVNSVNKISNGNLCNNKQ